MEESWTNTLSCRNSFQRGCPGCCSLTEAGAAARGAGTCRRGGPRRIACRRRLQPERPSPATGVGSSRFPNDSLPRPAPTRGAGATLQAGQGAGCDPPSRPGKAVALPSLLPTPADSARGAGQRTPSGQPRASRFRPEKMPGRMKEPKGNSGSGGEGRGASLRDPRTGPGVR